MFEELVSSAKRYVNNRRRRRRDDRPPEQEEEEEQTPKRRRRRKHRRGNRRLRRQHGECVCVCVLAEFSKRPRTWGARPPVIELKWRPKSVLRFFFAVDR